MGGNFLLSISPSGLNCNLEYTNFVQFWCSFKSQLLRMYSLYAGTEAVQLQKTVHMNSLKPTNVTEKKIFLNN